MMDELEARRDLAAIFRWTARLNMHEGISNHYSLAISSDGSDFLMNPYGRHWSKMRASELVRLNAHQEPGELGDGVDETAWYIHGALHRNVPQARCVLHVHSRYATALACLKDPEMLPIDQNTMRFYERVAVDDGFDGMGLGDEGERISQQIGNKPVLLMGNHGVLIAGSSVAQAFDELYYFERAAETFILALSTGRELNVVSPETARKTAQQWMEYGEQPEKHLKAIRGILDEEEPEYLN